MPRLLSGALIVLSILSLTACTPKEEAGKKDPRPVDVVVVTSDLWSETISTTGEIRARVQTDLAFRVSGRIIERRVDIGDMVKAGQVLARIDAQEQKADLDVALANLGSAQAQQTQARQVSDRQQSLFATGVSTRASLDAAQEALLRAQAAIDSAQAQVDTARDTLAQTDLKADADGVITARNAEVGEVAQAAQVVFTLAHDGPRDAVIQADETAFLGREIEDDVEVRLLSGGEAMAATVREISPTIDTATGTIRVKLALQDAAQVRLGSPIFALARYKPEATIMLPWSAMTSHLGQPAVWVVDAATKSVAIRPVEVRAYQSESFSVRSGLAPGDIVIAQGAKFLSEGDIVAFEGAAQ